jgi:DNA-binding CsgD family transcriptional regulator
VTAAERALAGGALAAEATVIPLCFGASALAFADRCEAALAALGSGLDAARRTGSSVTFAVCSWMASHVEYRRGALSAAEAYARDSLEPTVEAWFPAGVAFLADALVERGRLDEAEAAYRAHGLDRSHNRDFLVSNLMLASRGRLRHAQGRAGEALEDLHECGERLVAAGITNPAIVPWRSAAALAHLDAEDVGAARELAADELALAEGFGSPRGVGIALRAAGLVEERAGARDEALARLEQGAALLEGCGAPLEHARALVDLGATRRRAGQRADARDQLRRGLDLASACGATVLAQRARTELVAAGAKPRRERTTGADALTASERRVAEMAAEGMTNRQIAEALFVTQHTIAKHLTHAYEKLGIKQRTELAAALS